MMKIIFVLTILVIFPILITEASSYFNGDMIHHNLENTNHGDTTTNSAIITFNESSNTETVKRYLIFGKGSTAELGNFIQEPYSMYSSNGFFSIVTIPENTVSIFQSKGQVIKFEGYLKAQKDISISNKKDIIFFIFK